MSTAPETTSHLTVPPTTDRGSDQLVDFATELFLCGDSPPRRGATAPYLGELALHRVLQGRVAEADAILEAIGLGQWADSAYAVAQVVAYAARWGARELAQKWAVRLEEDARRQLDVPNPRVIIGAWLGTTRSVLDGTGNTWFQRAYEALDRSTYEARLTLATAFAVVGRWDEALDTSVQLWTGPSWTYAGELVGLAAEAGRFDVLEAFLRRVHASGLSHDESMLRGVVETCASPDQPRRAWKLLAYFDDVSTRRARQRITESVFETEGAEAVRELIEPQFIEHLRRGTVHTAARLLGLWGRYDLDGATDHLPTLLREVSMHEVQPRHLPDFLTGMAVLLPLVGRTDKLVSLFDGAPAGRHWFALLEHLPADNRLWTRALECALASVDRHNHRAFVAAVADRPGVLEELAWELGERAVEDPQLFGDLVASVASTGQLALADELRMRIPAQRRHPSTTALARQALACGQTSVGIARLEDLDRGFAPHHREYEAMRGLVYHVWDGIPRVSNVAF